MERGVSNLSYTPSVDDFELNSVENGSAVRFRSPMPRTPTAPQQNDEQLPPRPPTVPGLFDNNKPRHPPPRINEPPQPPIKSVDFSSQVLEDKAQVYDESGKKSKTMKKCLSVFFSYAGPFLMAVVYLIGGGYLFNYLEEGNEKVACYNLESNYKSKLNESVERTLSFARSGFNESMTRDKLEEALEKFAKDVFVIGFDPTKVCALMGTPGHLYEWNVLNAMFFCATVMTTIGYGHISPKSTWGKIILMVYSVLGIPIMVVFLTNIGDALATFFRYVYINICCFRCFLKRKKIVESNAPEVTQESTKGPPPKVGEVVVIEEEEEDDTDEYITIPISVVCFVLIAYMLLGSGLFRIWEKDWTLLDGTYFSFVTLSTIGFGDFVPGKDGFDKPETQVEMVVAAFYCLFGLAILSMCLNLIQDEIVAKFTWLGQKFGLIKKDEEEEEEEEVEEVETIPVPRVYSREMSDMNKSQTVSSQVFQRNKIVESSA